MENLKFYVDGQWQSAYTGYLQITGKPTDGETFSVDDGEDVSIVFEFDEDQALSQDTHVSVPIIQSFDDLERLESVVQNLSLIHI